MNVKITKLKSTALIPEYQTEQAAAFDFHACLDEPIVLQPLERAMIPTGLAVEIPEGFEMQIRARSGLSIKHGIAMVNGVGTIDADYRGELNILAINLSNEPFTIEHGTRVAQSMVTPVERVEWVEVESLSETARGSGGFGSTGIDKQS